MHTVFKRDGKGKVTFEPAFSKLFKEMIQNILIWVKIEKYVFPESHLKVNNKMIHSNF